MPYEAALDERPYCGCSSGYLVYDSTSSLICSVERLRMAFACSVYFSVKVRVRSCKQEC